MLLRNWVQRRVGKHAIANRQAIGRGGGDLWPALGVKRRLLLDTNIVLDYCDAARADHEATCRFIRDSVERSVALLVTVGSLKDVYYVLRRLYASEPLARQVVGKLVAGPLTAVDLKASYAKLALESDEPDFEDGLVRAAAETEGVFAIITRGGRAFVGSAVPAMSVAR